MIVTTDQMVGFTVINGTWQLQLSMLLGALDVLIFYPDMMVGQDQQGPNPELVFDINKTKYVTTAVHTFLVISLFIRSLESLRMPTLKIGLDIMGMIL